MSQNIIMAISIEKKLEGIKRAKNVSIEDYSTGVLEDKVGN